MVMKKKKTNLILLLPVLLLASALGLAVWKVQLDADREVVEGAGTSLHADHTSEYIEYEGSQYPVKRRMSSILLIGTDNYADTAEEVKNTGNYNFQFADFLGILVFDHDNKTVTPFQINRDTIANVPWITSSGKVEGYGVMQITFAHTFGSGREDSCENTVAAVRGLLFNAPIDHYLAFTMDAVPVMNDLVGGVTVTLEDDVPVLGEEYVKGATVTLHVSQAENLSRLFPNAKQRTYPVVMARLNEPRLFSKLFSCEARTIQEAYRISTKPLMMVETV